MSSELRKRTARWRLGLLTFVGLLAGAGAAIYFTGRHGRSERALTDEQQRLVQALEDSAFAAGGRSMPVRVAVFALEGPESRATSPLTTILDAEPTCLCDLLSPAEVRAGALDRFDVVIFPGGSGSKQAAALENEGKDAVRQFVEGGGGCVGVCGGAFLATAKFDWSLGLVNAKSIAGQRNIPGLGMRSMASRGRGTVKMELTDAGRRVFGDFPGLLDVPYTSGPVLSPAGRRDLPEYVPLALYRTEIWEYKPQRGTMINTPAIVAARFGKGRVMIFSPHPEMTEGLRSLMTRAVLSTARRSVDATETPEVTGPAACRDDARCRALLGSPPLCLRPAHVRQFCMDQQLSDAPFYRWKRKPPCSLDGELQPASCGPVRFPARRRHTLAYDPGLPAAVLPPRSKSEVSRRTGTLPSASSRAEPSPLDTW
jgi:putative intracellular protease/amidase